MRHPERPRFYGRAEGSPAPRHSRTQPPVLTPSAHEHAIALRRRRREPPHFAPPARASRRTRALPLDGLRRRLRYPRPLRPRRQYKVPGLPAALHFHSASRSRPRRPTLRSTSHSARDPRRDSDDERPPAHSPPSAQPLRTASRPVLSPAGPLLISRGRAPLGRHQPAHIFRV